MVDNAENIEGLDGPFTIENNRARCAIKKCETFGCPDIAKQMYQIAPGTNVWLCGKCKKEMEREKVK